jgi:hypothetical protein
MLKNSRMTQTDQEIAGSERFSPPHIQEISFPDGELPNYPSRLREEAFFSEYC